jgi:RHS repeat-associated protein
MGTIFHYDLEGKLLAETDGLGTVLKEYVWLGDQPVAVVLPPSESQPERVYYIYADQLNTPRAIVSGNNAVLWRWDPEPFGSRLPNEDVDGNGKKLVINLRYPGQYYDQETGLHYNYFRDYDPMVGRYIQSDPIGLQGGLNTYAYVANNPIMFSDPLGLIDPHDAPPSRGIGEFIDRLFNGGHIDPVPIPGNPAVPKDEARDSDCKPADSCRTCDKQYPSYLQCSDLSDYPYWSKHEALATLGTKFRLHNEQPAFKGPCSVSSGKEPGKHWNIRAVDSGAGSQRFVSLTSCPCCQDTSDGSKLKTKYRLH